MIKYINFSLLLGLTFASVSCQENESTDKSEVNHNEQVAPTSEDGAIWPRGNPGPKDLFTGNAYNYGLFPPDSIYTTLVGNVYFEPGARSNWHTHPGGQILIITAGKGYHQIEGQPIEVMRKGDVVSCPPNVKHWHGAAPDSALHQMYIVPNTEKGIVNWMEPVTEEQYAKY